MTMLSAIAIAFSTYSRLPMPNVEWNERNMRYSLCFFPLVGAVVGGALFLWFMLADWLALGGLLKGAVAAALNLAITGGIHMDGLMDTSDALGSHADREKKLLILKDSHVGAFGAMAMALYMLVQAAVLGSAQPRAFVFAFSLSRALTALLIVAVPSVSTGFLKLFKDSAERRVVLMVSIIWLALLSALAIFIDPRAAFAILALLPLALFHRRMVMREFGGMTGDLAGHLLMLSEIVYLIVIQVVGRIHL